MLINLQKHLSSEVYKKETNLQMLFTVGNIDVLQVVIETMNLGEKCVRNFIIMVSLRINIITESGSDQAFNSNCA